MRRVAVYPGSFNPFHQGHADIIKKALNVFDTVIIAVGINPDKTASITDEINVTERVYKDVWKFLPAEKYHVRVEVFSGLLKDFIVQRNESQEFIESKDFDKRDEIMAVLKGVRNAQDLEYERAQQYWNEDLGITVPTFLIISDRKFVHVSSSAIRALRHFKK